MMHQQAASSHYNSAQGGSQHYQGQPSIPMMGQSAQGSGMMGQRPMAPYRPSQQGTACTGSPCAPLWGQGSGGETVDSLDCTRTLGAGAAWCQETFKLESHCLPGGGEAGALGGAVGGRLCVSGQSRVWRAGCGDSAPVSLGVGGVS